MKNKVRNLSFVALVSLFVLSGVGCTVSAGVEGRAFYPKNDPRKGFFDFGGIDGIFSSAPSGGGFNLLGD
jgi:hypothetical protein